MRWSRFFHRKQCDDQLALELEAYIQIGFEENLARGMPPEQARDAARRKLGNQTLVREEIYRMNSFAFLETVWQDVRYSLRTLAKSPAFALVVVLSLALGIGANTAIFSLIDAALLRMLPVSHPEQLVDLTTTNPDYGPDDAFPYPAFKRYRDARQIFVGALAFKLLGNVALEVNGQGGIAVGQAVSGDYFQTLGVRAVAGRTILPSDDRQPGQGPVAVISYDYWRDRFGLDPTAVGRRIVLNNSLFTIIGVTPPDFYGVWPGQRMAVSVPLCMIAQVRPAWAAPGTPYDVLRSPFRNWLHVMARLQPGVSMDRALAAGQLIQQQAMREAADGLRAFPGDSQATRRVYLQTRMELSDGAKGLATLRRQFSKPLSIVMAIVGLLLLVACANVANLLLARLTSREKEIAVRLAMGAGRTRLLRQLITESVLLAAVGGALGLLLAFAASRSLLALMSHSNSPVELGVRPDGMILGFTLLVSLLTALVFGLIPAWRATRLDLSHAQMQAIRSAGKTTRRSTPAQGLVVLQVAVSMVLLIGAGLLTRSLGNLENFHPGFNKDHVVVFSTNPDAIGYGGQRRDALYGRLLDVLAAVPGVRSATLTNLSPLSGQRSNTNPVVIGFTPPAGKENFAVDVEVIAPRYFETLQTPLLLGRDFTAADREGAPRVAIINQAMSRYYFGNTSPIGRRFIMAGWLGDPRPIQIVGLAANARYHDLRQQADPMAYVPFLQSGQPTVTFAVRTAVVPETVESAIRQAVIAVDGRLPVFDMQTLGDQVDKSLVQERLVASLSSVFGALAVILACVGLYGLMAYTVNRRTNEIGIRMALGARRDQVAAMVLRETLRLVAIGLAIGIPAAMVASRWIASELYGLKPGDPITITIAGVAMAVVAAFAGYLPARRASRVDPMTALRYE